MKREFLNKKQSSYLQVYDDYRKKFSQGYETDYYKIREQYGETMGLAYNVISAGDYDPSTITTPLPTLDNVMSTASFIVDPFTIGSFKNVGYNEPLVWSIDRWYLFDIVSNGNEFKLGFYGGDAPLSSTTSSSIYTPNFYYESKSGDVYVGIVKIRNIGSNKTRLMIRVDSNYNFYVGTDINKYWLIGNCLTYMNIINTNTYTLRWGYEVRSLSAGNTVFNLINGSYSNIGIIDGVTWPNYRYGGPLNSNRYSIDDIVDQSNAFYRVYPIRNYSNDVTSLGQRTSFTLQCSGGGVDQVALFISSTPLLQTTYNRSADIAMELSLEFVVYDTISNVINAPQASVSMQLPSYPNLNNTNGQIYFRIEEDGKIYASKDKGSAVLICTRTYSKFYISLIVKGYSGNKQCQFKFITNNTMSISSNPPSDPLILSMPMLNKTASIFLPNGNTSDTFPMTAGKYYTTNVDSSPPLPYGLNRWYSIDIGNINNGIKIGFYTNSTISNHTETSTSVNPPQFYYNTGDRGVYMGGVLKKTLPNDWTVIFLLVDDLLNFYVGYGEAYYYLIDNITNYMSYIFPDTYTIRLGWEVHANTTSSYNLTNIDGGYYQSPSYQLTWPNNRIFNNTLTDYSDEGSIVNQLGLFKYVNFYNYSNSYSAQGSFTLQNVNTATNTDVIIVIFSNNTISNNTTNASEVAILGSQYLIYKLSTNEFIYNGVSKGAPNSYPDLNASNGQIYWDFTGGQVFVSRDSSNRVSLPGVVIPSGVISGGIMTSSATTSTSTYKFIVNNTQAIVPPPGPALPPLQPFPATPNGYTNSVVTRIAEGLDLTPTPGLEYLVIARPYVGIKFSGNYIWGCHSFIYGSIASNISSYKLGVVFQSSTVKNNLTLRESGGFQNSSGDKFYIYYDSLAGDIYVNNVVVYDFPTGLTTIGIGIDYMYNVYFATSPTSVYMVGNISSLQTLPIKTSYTPLIGMLAKFTTGSNGDSFTENLTYSFCASKDPYPEDTNIYNKLLYEPSSQYYKNEITVSSSSPTSYIFCEMTNITNDINSQFAKRIMLQCTNAVGIVDVILAFGSFHTFTAGLEYSFGSIQSASSAQTGIITYVQSSQAFFANTTNKYGINLLLANQNGQALIDIQPGNPGIMKAGSSISGLQTISNIYSSPLTNQVSSFFPFIGMFIATATPSSGVMYKVIVPQ